MTLDLREGTPADRSEVLQLLAGSMGEGGLASDPAFFSWKHDDSPFGASPIWVAFEAGRLVGVRVFSRWQWERAGRSLSAVRAVDTATHPSVRGKGVFRTLTMHGVGELTAAGTNMVFNTPNDKSGPGYLKMGWQQVGRIQVLARPTVRGLAGALGIARSTSDETSNESTTGRSRLRELLEHPGLATFLASSQGVPGRRLYTQKSSEYLRWRYLDCPRVLYGAEFEAEAGQLKAALVYRLRSRNARMELSISEMFVEASFRGAQAFRHSLAALVARARPDYVVLGAPGLDRRLLMGMFAGFAPPMPLGPTLYIRPLAWPAREALPMRIADWNCVLGDLELF